MGQGFPMSNFNTNKGMETSLTKLITMITINQLGMNLKREKIILQDNELNSILSLMTKLAQIEHHNYLVKKSNQQACNSETKQDIGNTQLTQPLKQS